MVTTEMLTLLNKVNTTPLDEVPFKDAEAISHEVLEEEPVLVARFGSAV